VWAPDKLYAGKSRCVLVVMLRMSKPSRGSSTRAGTGAASSGPELAICLTVLARRKQATTSAPEVAEGDPVFVVCSCNGPAAAIAHAKQQSTSCSCTALLAPYVFGKPKSCAKFEQILAAILMPPPLLPLGPPASTTAAAAAVGVFSATAAVAVVFTVGASDGPVKDALATSGTAYSLFVDS
jgi:hypothetical protein